MTISGRGRSSGLGFHCVAAKDLRLIWLASTNGLATLRPRAEITICIETMPISRAGRLSAAQKCVHQDKNFRSARQPAFESYTPPIARAIKTWMARHRLDRGW